MAAFAWLTRFLFQPRAPSPPFFPRAAGFGRDARPIAAARRSSFSRVRNVRVLSEGVAGVGLCRIDVIGAVGQWDALKIV